MIIVEHPYLFYGLFPIIAFLYASVGHGGASGYLALMALFGVSVASMKPTALLLNLVVSGVAFFHYHRSGYFSWKLFYPFALTSIPFAFLGGYLNVDPGIYKTLLGLILIIAIIRLLGWFGNEKVIKKKPSIWISLIIGALIGFFSGLIGIGGGIILSPVILIMHWADMKETAAVSALFIWINSLAGISGLMYGGASIPLAALLISILVLFGGFLGGRFGSKNENPLILKRLLAFVLLLASIKLFLT